VSYVEVVAWLILFLLLLAVAHFIVDGILRIGEDE
jgi:hypothetical protein